MMDVLLSAIAIGLVKIVIMKGFIWGGGGGGGAQGKLPLHPPKIEPPPNICMLVVIKQSGWGSSKTYCFHSLSLFFGARKCREKRSSRACTRKEGLGTRLTSKLPPQRKP